MIKNETLSIDISEKENKGEIYDLNGLNVKLDIEKRKM